MPNLVIVTLSVVVIGAMGGIAYATGFTIVGLEVDDSTRGRVFAFFTSATQVILFLVIAVAPFLSKAITELIASATGSGNVKVGNVVSTSAGQNVVLLLAALIAVLVGVSAYRQMDDRRGVPLREDLVAAVRVPRSPRCRPKPAGQPGTSRSPARAACSSRWRAARARARPPRRGCWPSGCGSRASTW